MNQSINLLDIDSLVSLFLKEHDAGIKTMHRIYFSDSNELSIRALTEELADELRSGCVTFLNKNDPNLEGLWPYLFYISNAFCKKSGTFKVKKKTEYLCPGCLFLGKDNLVTVINKYYRCESCEKDLKNTNDPKMILFFRTFFKHNKAGYHCNECDRFIPHPIDESPIISCPYTDCTFVGPWHSLKRMHHPNSQSKIEHLILDGETSGGTIIKNLVADSDVSADLKMEAKEDLLNQINMLREIIDTQKNNVPYSSSDANIKHKFLCYEAFDILLKKYPEEMSSYLLDGSRSGGFQCKVFQEYIKLLEESLPYSFKKNNKQFMVESLLDDNLTIFDGISEYRSIVSDKLEIKNETTEFYIGGRTGAISRPFYIGKLLSISDKKTKLSLMNNVLWNTFSKIKLKDVSPGTEVIVTHLRIPPHYQMGGMVYVNRVRKKIVERAKLLMNKESND